MSRLLRLLSTPHSYTLCDDVFHPQLGHGLQAGRCHLAAPPARSTSVISQSTLPLTLSVCPSLSVSLPSLALSVRLYTGRSEVERLALSPAPSSTSDSTEVDVRRKVELSRCLRRSSQLSPYLAPIYGTAAMPRSREPKVAPRAIATVEEVKEVSAKLVHTIVTAKRIKQRSR